jgi:hypothetical protein
MVSSLKMKLNKNDNENCLMRPSMMGCDPHWRHTPLVGGE